MTGKSVLTSFTIRRTDGMSLSDSPPTPGEGSGGIAVLRQSHFETPGEGSQFLLQRNGNFHQKNDLLSGHLVEISRELDTAWKGDSANPSIDHFVGTARPPLAEGEKRSFQILEVTTLRKGAEELQCCEKDLYSEVEKVNRPFCWKCQSATRRRRKMSLSNFAKWKWLHWKKERKNCNVEKITYIQKLWTTSDHLGGTARPPLAEGEKWSFWIVRNRNHVMERINSNQSLTMPDGHYTMSGMLAFARPEGGSKFESRLALSLSLPYMWPLERGASSGSESRSHLR
jgi:hypothetical protein